MTTSPLHQGQADGAAGKRGVGDGLVRSLATNVATRLQAAASANPDAAALVDGDAVWDYRRLWHEAQNVARACSARGVVPGDRVAIVMGSWPEHVAAWYGALIAGAVVADLSTLLGDEEWQLMLDDLDARVVVCEAAYADRLGRLVGHHTSLYVAGERGGGFGPAAGADAPVAVEPKADEDPAVIAYTSGTTGLPKGVLHTHGAVSRQLDLLAGLHKLGPGDFVYQAVPLFTLQGYLPQVVSPISGGAAVVLADKFSAEHFARASWRYPITYVSFSSPMLQRVIDLPESERPKLDALRVATAGGAPLQPEQRRRFEEALGVHVTQGYGMTEMLGVYVADYDGAPVGSCGRQHPAKPRLVVVLDDDGNEVPAGTVGEISVHRSCALLGYWNDPDRTASAFDGDWYRTGDIGCIDRDGFYFVVDRKKDMVIRGGFNIYPAEIERVLDERPEVTEVAVIGAADDRVGEVPVAYVVVDAEPTAELAEELRSYVRQRLGALKTPERIELVDHDDLPRNALGKVVKRELQARDGEKRQRVRRDG